MSHRRTVLSQEALAKTDFIGLKHRPLMGPSWPDKTYGHSEKSSEDERRPAGHPGVQRPWPLGCGVGQEGEPAQENACKRCCPCPGCDSVPHSSSQPGPLPTPQPPAKSTAPGLAALTSRSLPVCMDQMRISKESWAPAETMSPLEFTATQENWVGRGDVKVRKLRYLREESPVGTVPGAHELSWASPCV